MRTSVLPRVKNDPIIILRKSYIQICEGNKDAAILLSYFEYWHNIKLAMQEKNKKANDVREKHGKKRMHDETLLQFHTREEIYTECLGLVSYQGIVNARKILVKLKFIREQKNPDSRFHFDKTTYFELRVSDVSKAIISIIQNEQLDDMNHPDRLHDLNTPIAETTTEVNNKNKTPYNPPSPKGDGTDEILSLKTHNTSVDFKSCNMDNILSDAKSIKSKDNKEFKNIPPSVQRCIIESVEFLNKKEGTKFKADNQTTIRHIVNRLKEGYTPSDFKKVIVNQCAAWKDNKDMQQYLRPSTLFSASKIENYLNNTPQQKKTNKNPNRVGEQSHHNKPVELNPEHFYARPRP